MLLAWIGWRSLPIHFHLLRRPHVLRGRCRPGREAAGRRAVAPYVPRAAADPVLHGVVREHLETFLAAPAARTDGVGLPRFIEREFRASSGAGCSSMAFSACGATTVRSSASCRCRVKAARSVPVAAAGAWRSRQRISYTRSSPRSPPASLRQSNSLVEPPGR